MAAGRIMQDDGPRIGNPYHTDNRFGPKPGRFRVYLSTLILKTVRRYRTFQTGQKHVSRSDGNTFTIYVSKFFDSEIYI